MYVVYAGYATQWNEAAEHLFHSYIDEKQLSRRYVLSQGWSQERLLQECAKPERKYLIFYQHNAGYFSRVIVNSPALLFSLNVPHIVLIWPHSSWHERQSI